MNALDKLLVRPQPSVLLHRDPQELLEVRLSRDKLRAGHLERSQVLGVTANDIPHLAADLEIVAVCHGYGHVAQEVGLHRVGVIRHRV